MKNWIVGAEELQDAERGEADGPGRVAEAQKRQRGRQACPDDQTRMCPSPAESRRRAGVAEDQPHQRDRCQQAGLRRQPHQ